MNDSKANEAAAEPPLDCRVGQRIKRYLRQLAPHQMEREGPTLLRDALAEIDVLAYWGPRWETEHKENERLQATVARVEAVIAEFEGMTGSGYRYMAAHVRDAIKVPNA